MGRSPVLRHYFQYAPRTHGIGVTWLLASKAGHQTPPQTCQIRIRILTRSLGDSMPIKTGKVVTLSICSNPLILQAGNLKPREGKQLV